MSKAKNPRLVALGQRIKSARQGGGLSQEALGELIGLHRVSVNRIEAGGHDVPFTTLTAIATALGVTVQELTADPPPAPVAADGKKGARV